MTCQEFEDVLREDWQAPAVSEHATGCSACSAQLERRRSLAGGLAALAAETATASASPEVEARLLQALRASRPTVTAMPSRRGRLWWAGAAAAAVVAAVTVWPRYPRVEMTPPPAPVPGVVAAAVPPVVPVAPVRRAPVRRAPTRRSPVAKAVREIASEPAVPSRAAAAAGKAADDAEFIPLPYAARLSPAESFDVVRVRMPRSAVMRFGLPVSAERAWEPVNADIVFGQDGMARAIRFVRQER